MLTISDIFEQGGVWGVLWGDEGARAEADGINGNKLGGGEGALQGVFWGWRVYNEM